MENVRKYNEEKEIAMSGTKLNYQKPMEWYHYIEKSSNSEVLAYCKQSR